MLRDDIVKVLEDNNIITSEIKLSFDNVHLHDIFDSLSYIQTIVLFEEKYKIKFDDEELLMETFETLDKLSAVVKDKIANKKDKD